ncbi:MAG: hypothetical protein IPP90_14120 [Gemmatimonadaceae bacterium]|nr:hypothetical protein [Gemmatimonadaceae bacterium]
MKRAFVIGSRPLVVPVCLLAALAAPAAAQPSASTVDPRLYAGLTWRNLGPFRAGRVGAVSGAIGQPGVFYAGYPGGGLWKTTSAGQTWFPVFDAIKTVSSVGAVEVAPSDPNVVYVGTGDMITGGTLDQGNGVYKSTDAGATWTSLGLEGTRHIQTISVDPRSPDVLLVGALGDHVNHSDMRGVYRSTDGGRTWAKTLFIDNETGVTKVSRAYDTPDVVFATSTRHYAPPGYAVGSYRSWQFSVAARPLPDTGRTSASLYKSLDGGVTWKEIVGGGLPRHDGRMSVAIAMGTNAQRVYLITNSALYRSDNGGTTWQRMAADDDRIHNGQGGYSCGVYVDPKNPDLVYTINTAAYKSTDGGKTFTGMKGAPGGDDPQQMWIDPTNGQRIFMGLDQGATVSLDGGATWSSWYNQSTEQLYHLSADNSFPYWVYATQQDAGAIRTRIRGNYGAVTMFDWNSVNGWEWGTIVADPLNPQNVFASGNGLVRMSYPSEQRINVSPAIDPAAKARTTSSQPLVWAPWNSRQLLVGLNFVASTVDGGAHWTRISPELAIPAGMDSATAANTLGGRGAIESLAASPAAPGVIWAGTNNGLIHVTRNGGATWTDVSIPNIPSPRRAMISAIDASPHAAGTAYVAVEYLRIGEHTPYFFRTRDFGKTWTKIVTGLPADEPSGSFARVIRADPKKAGLLFAGTESSVYVSFNDGDLWQSLAMNLPNSPARDLLIKGNDLLVATHGRGLWVIDDISMLRQVNSTIAAKPAHLFAPGLTTRVRRNVNDDTPLPPEIPHAVNPLDGVIIDYWLGASPSGTIAVDILNASGAVVRHLTSVLSAPVPEAARPPHPNFWVAPPTALPTSVGMHRVNWDLRYDAPPAFSHSFEINATPGLTPATPEGALAPPGVYTVRLTIGGTPMSQTVTVRNDPRSTATPAALAAQHDLMMQITAGMRAAWDAQQQVTALRTALSQTSGANTEVTAAIATLRAALDAAVGSETARVTFRSLNGALASQLTAQDNADFAPTPSMRAAFTATCRDLATAHTSWQRLVQRDVPVANAILSRHQIAPLTLPRAEVPPRC